MKQKLLLLVAICCSCSHILEAACTDLVISAYVEGSSNNKCIEIYNGTGAAIDLSTYTIDLYNNGAEDTPNSSIALTGMLADSSYYLLCHDQVALAGIAPNQLANFAINGDDAIALNNGTENVDVFGEIGFDPGSEWAGTTCTEGTQNQTLVKKEYPANDCLYSTFSGVGDFALSIDSLYQCFPQDDISALHTLAPSVVCPTFTLVTDTIKGLFCTGEGAIMALTTTDDASEANIQWFVNEVAIENATDDTLNITFNNSNLCEPQVQAFTAVVSCDGNTDTIVAGEAIVYPPLQAPMVSTNSVTCVSTFTPVCPSDTIPFNTYIAEQGDAATTLTVPVFSTDTACDTLMATVNIAACAAPCPGATLTSPVVTGGVCVGDTVRSSINIASNLTVLVQWYANGEIIAGATDTTLAYIATTDLSCGSEDVSLMAIAGCEDGSTDTIQAGVVNVFAAPQIPMVVADTIDENGCSYTIEAICPDDVLSFTTYTANFNDPDSTITIDVNNGAACGTTTFDIVVPACEAICLDPFDASTVSPSGPVCNMDGVMTLDLMTLVTGDTTGTWTGAGVTDNVFDASALADGMYLVTYTIAAQEPCPAASSSQIIMVLDCNLSPIAVNDNILIVDGLPDFDFNITSNDTDPEGQNIILVSVQNPPPAFGTITFEANGDITFVPGPSFTSGSISLTYIISDGVNTDTGLLTITLADCAAEAGNFMLVAETDSLVCFEEEFIKISDRNFTTFDGYAQQYLLTTATAPHEILAIGVNNRVPTPISGKYNIYAINFDANNAPIFNIGSTIEGIQAQEGLGSCFDLDPNPITVYVLAPVTVEGEAFCSDSLNQHYSVVVYVRGGAPEFFNTGNYEINYDPGVITWMPDSGFAKFELEHIPCFTNVGDSIIFNIDVDNDGSLCVSEPLTLFKCPCILPPPPPEPDTCDFDAGIMPDTLIQACAGDTVSVQSQGISFNDSIAIATYLIVDDSLNILDTSSTGTFALTQNLTTNTTYTIVAIVGEDNDGDGIPDQGVNDTCTVISSGTTEVVFLDPIEIELVSQSDDCETLDSLNFFVVVNITGGLPAFDGSDYIIDGVAYDGVMDTVFVGLVDTAVVPFAFTATDGQGCSAIFSGSCRPLPIELATFTGEVLTEGNLIKWVTATETNNDFFTLYRSSNGVDFEAIGTITGAGNSVFAQSYSYLDKNAPSGLSYYQLEQTDFDQQTSRSHVITLTRGEMPFDIIQIAPVPTTQLISVDFNSNVNAPIKVSIFDVTGRLVSTQNVASIVGYNKLNINTTDYASGMYILSLHNGTAVVNTKFVKE